MSSDSKVVVNVVVNGVGVDVETNTNAALQALISKALEQAKATGGDWELKDEAGNVINPQTKISDLPAVPTKLWLSLRAGVNG